MQLKAYKYRIYPTKEQEVLFAKTFGCVRFVWNKLVENFNNNDGSTVNEKTLKDQEEFEFLKEVSAATLQQKTRDFIEFKTQFFNKNEKQNLENQNSRRNLIDNLLDYPIKSLD